MARRMLMPRRAARRATLALAGIALLTASGCGVAQSGNTDRGQQLFTSKCASCHALKDAGSTGALQGPDLDAAFAQARASGMDSDTIAGVVKAQVENPRPTTNNPSVSMPADLVTGGDLDDVASYVASVAGAPGIKGPQLPNDPGATVFANNQCSGCHTLTAAGTQGTGNRGLRTQGPNLDQRTETYDDALFAIQNGGFSGAIMPQNIVVGEEAEALARFVAKYAGSEAEESPRPGQTPSP